MRTLDARTGERAATQVVGVAILLGLTVVSLGTLTAGIGTVIEENAASADAARVADGMTAALEPVERTGHARERLAFTGGRVETVSRDVHILDGTRTVRRLEVGALVWTSGDSRVGAVAGAVIRGQPGNANLYTAPPVTASRGDGGVLVVGVPRLGTDAGRSVSAAGGTTVPLRTNVSHERTDLGVSRFRVAIETRTPGALDAYFREQGASVAQRDIDGDGVSSVVATYPGQRRAYLVVHDLRLSVGGVHSAATPTDSPASDEKANEGAADDSEEDQPPSHSPIPDGGPTDDDDSDGGESRGGNGGEAA